MHQVVTSPRGPARVHTGRKGGNQHWARDVHHLVGGDRLRTLCGRHAGDWLTLDGIEVATAAVDHNCCTRCAPAYAGAVFTN
jgi:hypothetical protein